MVYADEVKDGIKRGKKYIWYHCPWFGRPDCWERRWRRPNQPMSVFLLVISLLLIIDRWLGEVVRLTSVFPVLGGGCQEAYMVGEGGVREERVGLDGEVGSTWEE